MAVFTLQAVGDTGKQQAFGKDIVLESENLFLKGLHGKGDGWLTKVMAG